MRREEGGQSQTTEALSIEGAVEPLIAGQIVLGKYRIVGRLGVGGMAEVYEATHLQLGSPVALKLPLGRAGSSRGAKMASRLLREAQVGASLDADRVVRVFDVGVLDDGTPVIVLERLHGESMAERLARVEKVSVATAIAWVREACAGLSEAHQKGIVHRDVKPSNLFLEKKRDGERLRILDFGIATIRAAAEEASDTWTNTDSRGPIGSPPYMSPEQIRDSDAVDARTDVWALGITLFELVAGRRPFCGVGSALVASIVSDRVPTLSSLGLSVDPALQTLIDQCLERDPSLRPADAAELGARLDALVAGAPLPVSTRLVPVRTWRAPIIAGTAACALGVAIAVGSAQGRGPRRLEAEAATSAAFVDARSPDPSNGPAERPPLGAPTVVAMSSPSADAPGGLPLSGLARSTTPASANAPAPLPPLKASTRLGSEPHRTAELPAIEKPPVGVTSTPPAPSARSVLDDRVF